VIKTHTRGIILVGVEMVKDQSFGIDLPAPANVLDVQFQMEMSSTLGADGLPTAAKIIPVVVFDVDPRAAVEHHEFVWAVPNQALESEYPLRALGVYRLPVPTRPDQPPEWRPVGLYRRILPERLRKPVSKTSNDLSPKSGLISVP
jgi:hypothetical protein